MRPSGRALRRAFPCAWVAALLAVAFALALPLPADAAPKPETALAVGATAPVQVTKDGEDAEIGDEEGGDEEVVKQEPYGRILEMLLYHQPQDTMGTAAFAQALRTCEEGRFDEGMQQLRIFTQQHPRNLLLNEALETILLVRGNREFKDEPLKLYLAAQVARRSGQPDTAAALAREGLARYPGARMRHHWSYMLGEIARERGDHPAAVTFALAVADTASKSRLAPYALRLAAEETLAIGADPARALRYYQDLIERYPESPLAPDARARALDLRKRLQR